MVQCAVLVALYELTPIFSGDVAVTTDESEENVAPENDKDSECKGDCVLCDTKDTVLQESHSIPKFAYDWMRETSKTGFLRDMDDVNKRHQDGPKKYLLCGDCERKLAVLEKQLAENCFKKIANYQKQKTTITITEGIRVAVLSIFWRALITTDDRSNDRTAEDNIVLKNFLIEAKEQILAEQCMFQICIAPFIGGAPYYDLPSGVTYNLERGCGSQDARFGDNPHRYFIAFKLPFMYFYIFSDGWHASEIRKSTYFRAGNLRLDTIKDIPNTLKTYILDLQHQFNASKRMMNIRSMQQIINDVEKNKKITGSDKSMLRSKKKKQ